MNDAARIKVCVPCDSAARAVGADAVADALVAECAARGLAIELVRTSSRGLFWLEPLVEVETGRGRDRLRPGRGRRRRRAARRRPARAAAITRSASAGSKTSTT